MCGVDDFTRAGPLINNQQRILCLTALATQLRVQQICASTSTFKMGRPIKRLQRIHRDGVLRNAGSTHALVLFLETTMRCEGLD